ncbi:27148_t:CDS:2 [Gigaspora margarita]|uniref:27148_t:CDS:1 n=1 Tax=Gigaspora margarita TaxID=4874 RepID=A0ABM8VYL9_GIGMA|nr:27148_t:CDS:2 [Gigaspora margarita]
MSNRESLVDYSEELEKYLKGLNIKSFDNSKFSEHKIIGYKVNDPVLSDYADIYLKCWSPALDQRPNLDKISEILENILEKTTTEFIEINNQNELDGENLSNPDDSENNIHPNDYTAVVLNELDEIIPNNNFPILNEGMHFSIRSNKIMNRQAENQRQWNEQIQKSIEDRFSRLAQVGMTTTEANLDNRANSEEERNEHTTPATICLQSETRNDLPQGNYPSTPILNSMIIDSAPLKTSTSTRDELSITRN